MPLPQELTAAQNGTPKKATTPSRHGAHAQQAAKPQTEQHAAGQPMHALATTAKGRPGSAPQEKGTGQ